VNIPPTIDTLLVLAYIYYQVNNKFFGGAFHHVGSGCTMKRGWQSSLLVPEA
jgi:hypothetical protein